MTPRPDTVEQLELRVRQLEETVGILVKTMQEFGFQRAERHLHQGRGESLQSDLFEVWKSG